MNSKENPGLTNNSILDFLSSTRVVTFEIEDENQTLVITEACDNYFWAKFNKQEALKMLEELATLINSMKE